MFLVLIVHADFLSLGRPTDQDVLTHPFSSMMRYIVQSLALVCVNVYIIISGYFGIKLKAKSILNFIFLVVFWRLLINVCALVAEQIWNCSFNLSLGRFFKLCVPGYGDWFVEAYLILLFLAPLLNAFIEKIPVKVLWFYIFLYIGVQIIFAWTLRTWYAFGFGYSTLSFVGLYVLGAAVKRTAINRIKHPLFLYFAISIAIGMLIFFAQYFSPTGIVFGFFVSRFGDYDGLFIMLASAMLFLAFKRMHFTSRAVNYIAVSSFAVYLFHMHPLMRSPYLDICKYLYTHYSTWAYIGLISAFIVAVFFTAVAIDLVRRWIWNRIAATEKFTKFCHYLTKFSK